jgi:hypothetical protein
MLNKITLCTVFVLFVANPLQAELRFTMRTEARKVESPQPPNPILAKFGEMLAKAIAPDGVTQATFLVGENRARIELGSAVRGLQKGTVILRQPDGFIFALNANDRTYQKMVTPEFRTNSLMTTNSKVSSVRSGEFVTISGIRSERVTLVISFDFTAEASRLPPGFPSTWTIDWDMWVTDRFKMPSSLVAIVNPAMQALGLEKYLQDEFVMRQIIRSPLLGGYEMESVIVNISEEPAAPELFAIPSDYTPASGR